MTRDRLKFGPLRVGIGGPVCAGKTSMTEALCKILASDVSMAVITNDIYTREDADYLVRAQVLSSDRICGSTWAHEEAGTWFSSEIISEPDC